MNHKTFEDWLFLNLEPQDGELTSEQSAALEEHLKNCESCRNLSISWRQVEHTLSQKSLVSPEAGFTARWVERQELEQKKIQRRQSLAVLGFLFAGGAALFGSLIIIALPWLGKPEVLFWSWIYRLTTLVTIFDPLHEVLSLLLRGTQASLSPIWLVFAAGILSEIAVLWLVLYRVLTNPRRVTQ